MGSINCPVCRSRIQSASKNYTSLVLSGKITLFVLAVLLVLTPQFHLATLLVAAFYGWLADLTVIFGNKKPSDNEASS